MVSSESHTHVIRSIVSHVITCRLQRCSVGLVEGVVDEMIISTEEMLARLGAGILFGAAIGYERERAGRQAGLRTQLLVSLASTTFMIVSTQFVFFQQYGKDDLINVDTSRIAASVVSGVGFLGAGAILRTGIGVQGLTTAASLWMTAAIGLAAGGGMFLVAGAATTAALICLIFLRRLEGKQWRLLLRRIVAVLDDNPGHIKAITDCLARYGVALSDVTFDRNLKAHKTRLIADVRLPSPDDLDRLVSELAETPSVRRIKVQRPG
jgi:putative Mg2+ transporter-C (MgtC) family protein